MGKEPFAKEDRELVGRCQKGDEQAFEELVRKYQQTVFNLVYHNIGYRNDIEDIAQNVFTKIFFSLPKFDNKRPSFPGFTGSQSTSATMSCGAPVPQGSHLHGAEPGRDGKHREVDQSV